MFTLILKLPSNSNFRKAIIVFFVGVLCIIFVCVVKFFFFPFGLLCKYLISKL